MRMGGRRRLGKVGWRPRKVRRALLWNEKKRLKWDIGNGVAQEEGEEGACQSGKIRGV